MEQDVEIYPDSSSAPERFVIEGTLTRRQVLGSGMLLGAMLLTGCQSRRSAELPGPRYPATAGSSTPTLASGPLPIPTIRPLPGLPASVVPRTQWTRMDLARPSEANPMNGVNRITVHHDAILSADIRTMGDAERRLQAVRTSHVGRGWADIGYHFVIDPSGRVWEGRPVQYQGAHVEFNNEHNLGIMVMGNFDQQSPAPQALAALDRFLAGQMVRYNVPLRRVFTHQEIRPTACPGRALQRYMIGTRARGGSLALASR
jgi:hypothetical protein